MTKNNNTPLFSILIANYNNGKYLMDAIESVRRQTYANWEIVLVDDCSTDNSMDLYRDLEKDERVSIYSNDCNRGCGYTKARCAELAHGEICGFLDPDDELIETAIEKHVKAHIEHPKASMVSSRLYFCDEGMDIKSESRLLRLPQSVTYLEHGDYMPEHFLSFKKERYALTKGINSEYQYGIDQDLCFKLEEVGDWYVLDEVLYKYRQGIGISHTKRNETLLWNSLIRLDAAARRSYPAEKRFEICEHSISKYIALEKLEAAEQRDRIIRSTLSYRLGNWLLKPLSLFKEKMR